VSVHTCPAADLGPKFLLFKKKNPDDLQMLDLIVRGQKEKAFTGEVRQEWSPQTSGGGLQTDEQVWTHLSSYIIKMFSEFF